MSHEESSKIEKTVDKMAHLIFLREKPFVLGLLPLGILNAKVTNV